MAKIAFNNNVDFQGFNLSVSGDAQYPDDINNTFEVNADTENSLVYTFVNDILCDPPMLYARYKSTALTRDVYSIYRQSIDSTIKTYLGTIDGVSDGFYDYNIASGEAYKYIVETQPNNTDASTYSGDKSMPPVVSLELDYYLCPQWKYWSICDIIKDNEYSINGIVEFYRPSDKVFLIKNNVEVGSITNNLNIISYNTLGKYGRIIQNEQKYDSGNISCLIADLVGYQDLRCGKEIKVEYGISSMQEIDSYFIQLQRSNGDYMTNYSNTYFLFPEFSDKFFVINHNMINTGYIEIKQKPDNWSEIFTQYYTLQNNGIYVPVSGYTLLTEKPEGWDAEYYDYYVLDNDHHSYIANIDPVWTGNKYYEYQIPEWRDNFYYESAVYYGGMVPETNIVMNTNNMIVSWRDCLSNGNMKLLKAPNGQSWVIMVSCRTTNTLGS